jgi:hypothetical protein
MFWVWFIVTIIIMSGGLYALGRWDTSEDKKHIFWAIFFGSILWPGFLALVIILSPFGCLYGFYWLGEKHRGNT